MRVARDARLLWIGLGIGLSQVVAIPLINFAVRLMPRGGAF
ncbi:MULTISPECIES: hypothetical protein [Pirellulaceae]|nr:MULTISPECIES: hypothetical protein [Pirellulaceae]